MSYQIEVFYQGGKQYAKDTLYAVRIDDDSCIVR